MEYKNMKFLLRISRFCIDFLFPKTSSVVYLESLDTGEMLQSLPTSKPVEKAGVITIFDYSYPTVKKMIWELKYSGNRTIAAKFGEIIYDVLTTELEDVAFAENFRSPVLVPVPISDQRHFERGWNQAELLLEAVKTRDQGRIFKYLPRQLVRYRHTESQTKTTSKKERLENIKDSMRVANPESVRGKCVVVVDDVFTTGATFAEAKRALKEAGAKKILCIAVAH